VRATGRIGPGSIGCVPVSSADEQLLRDAYAAFNARDVDGALALMAPDVDWPNGMEGGRVVGRDAVREYWTRQFRQIDSRVEPLGFRALDEGRVAVDVRQVVRALDGGMLSDGAVGHVYELCDGQIARMDITEPPSATVEPAAHDDDHGHDHHYLARTAWSGSTAGFQAYDRTHEASCPPASPTLTLSADPAFKGDPALLNPEQLLVLAASSCQLLSFLAVAARARIDVVAYEDDAEGVMPADERPMRIARIVLRPRIAVHGDTPDERLHQLAEIAHRECFIANSLSSEVVVEPTFRRER
jgi:organic hydroperoxide reductase OsmC/OhrA/ketosteroid isomerase-like protein